MLFVDAVWREKSTSIFWELLGDIFLTVYWSLIRIFLFSRAELHRLMYHWVRLPSRTTDICHMVNMRIIQTYLLDQAQQIIWCPRNLEITQECWVPPCLQADNNSQTWWALEFRHKGRHNAGVSNELNNGTDIPKISHLTADKNQVNGKWV